MLTVVILTQNEQANLPGCLAAIPERYPIVIVDSGSTDNTVAIAKSRSCRIYTNPWPGFAEQRNFAIKLCGISTPWLLFIDADEIYPQTFYDWFESGMGGTDTLDVLMVPSVLYLRGKRLNHAPATLFIIQDWCAGKRPILFVITRGMAKPLLIVAGSDIPTFPINIIFITAKSLNGCINMLIRRRKRCSFSRRRMRR